MRGSLKQRSKGSWSLILHLGYERDPETGKRTRRQKWLTFRGTRQKAEAELTKQITDANGGTFVDPSSLTLGAWLKEWLPTRKAQLAASTYTRYDGIITDQILPSTLSKIPLQKLRSTHIEAYYAASTFSASTLALHHAILHKALRKAKKDNAVSVNAAVDLDGKPTPSRSREDARKHCWTAAEARDFLTASAAAGAQPAAFYALALDSGMRKGELCGLRWTDVDLDTAKIRIVQQLLKPGKVPIFGPTKTSAVRTVSLGAETVARLKTHKRTQAALKLANRTTYSDFGLVFAKEWGDVKRSHEALGQPLQANNLGQREYKTIITAAKVRPIKFHGLRHTCATLLLVAKVPVHVVSERLGHKNVSMTMEIYAHVLPDMQEDAAATLSALLHPQNAPAEQRA